jgi:hypothetical protein
VCNFLYVDVLSLRHVVFVRKRRERDWRRRGGRKKSRRRQTGSLL